VLGLPDELRDEAFTAAPPGTTSRARSSATAPFLGLPGVADGAAEELAKVSAQLDEFEERLEAYMRDDLGVVDLSEEELKQLGLDVALDPAEWLAQHRP
jgi:hypothetical protein